MTASTQHLKATRLRTEARMTNDAAQFKDKLCFGKCEQSCNNVKGSMADSEKLTGARAQPGSSQRLPEC